MGMYSTYKTIISLQTEIFERISAFIEDTLKMPPPMEAGLLCKVKTLELGIFEKMDALPKDLNTPYYWILSQHYPEFTSKTAELATELFQRVSVFKEDFLRLSAMGLHDIAAKVTGLVKDLLQDISSFVKDIAQEILSPLNDSCLEQKGSYYQDITTMINNFHTGFFTDISIFVKGFRNLMPSFGEDLFKQMSSLENDFLKLMSSLKKDLLKLPLPTGRAHRLKLRSALRTHRDSPYADSGKSSNFLDEDCDESSSYSIKEPRKGVSYFKKGGEGESSKPSTSKRATANWK